MAVYLDQELTISVSGFPYNERVFVFLDLGGGLEPPLGLADSDKDGSWSLSLRPLGGQNSVKRTAATILAQGHRHGACKTVLVFSRWCKNRGQGHLSTCRGLFEFDLPLDILLLVRGLRVS